MCSNSIPPLLKFPLSQVEVSGKQILRRFCVPRVYERGPWDRHICLGKGWGRKHKGHKRCRCERLSVGKLRLMHLSPSVTGCGAPGRAGPGPAAEAGPSDWQLEAASAAGATSPSLEQDLGLHRPVLHSQDSPWFPSASLGILHLPTTHTHTHTHAHTYIHNHCTNTWAY